MRSAQKQKQAELAPFIEQALARKPRMKPIDPADIPVVESFGRRGGGPGAQATSHVRLRPRRRDFRSGRRSARSRDRGRGDTPHASASEFCDGQSGILRRMLRVTGSGGSLTAAAP